MSAGHICPHGSRALLNPDTDPVPDPHTALLRSAPDLIEDLHDVGQVDLSQLGGGPRHPVALVRGLGGTVQTARGQRLQQRLFPRLCLCLFQSSSEIIKKRKYKIAVLRFCISRYRFGCPGSGPVM
jgi:hypothetical protein